MEQWWERSPRTGVAQVRFQTRVPFVESRDNLSGPKPYLEVKIQRIGKNVGAL